MSVLPERVTPATSERAMLLQQLQHVMDHPRLFDDPEAEMGVLYQRLRDLNGDGAPIDWWTLWQNNTWEGLASKAGESR